MIFRNRRLRSFFTVLTSVAAVSAMGLGLAQAARSPLFTLRSLAIELPAPGAPLDRAEIQALAGVPLDQINLFDLSLAPIESRLLAHPWVRSVSLSKRFPQTLGVSIVFREPRALLQTSEGGVRYIDQDGTVFGSVSLDRAANLPILSGFASQERARILECLGFLTAWDRAGLTHLTDLSSLSYDPERGYRAWVMYSLSAASLSPRGRSRAQVTLGHTLEAEPGPQLDRLSRVMASLTARGIAARQIWADTGKKVVVKIGKGS